MTFKSIKTMAAAAALLAGIAGAATVANAQTPVLANLTTSSTITVADIRDMEFGTWFIIHRNADNFELLMNNATGIVTAENLAGGPTNSQAVKLVPGDLTGRVSASLPTGADGLVINMQRDAIVNFVDTNIALQTIQYSTATEAAAALGQAINVPVTVVTGGTPEVVNFSGEIAVTGQPADAAHSASFNVTFAF